MLRSTHNYRITFEMGKKTTKKNSKKLNADESNETLLNKEHLDQERANVRGELELEYKKAKGRITDERRDKYKKEIDEAPSIDVLHSLAVKFRLKSDGFFF